MASAIAEGARLVAGGRRPTEPELQAGFYYRPTVFADVRRDMRIVREEVFGPVLTVERFTTEDEAIELGNDTTYGLAGAVWTADASRAQRVAARLRHGTVWINDYNAYLPQAEWGGFKQSGIGRELGPSGLDEYREAKHIWQNTDPRPGTGSAARGTRGHDDRGDDRADRADRPGARPTRAAGRRRPTIAVRDLWKVFGPAEHKIIGTPDADLPRDELRQKTGCDDRPSATSRSTSARRGLRRHGPVRAAASRRSCAA